MPSAWRETVLGGLLAVLTAAAFALNNACARRAVLSGTVIQGIMITVPYGIPFFLLAAAVSGTLGHILTLSHSALVWFILAGIVHFVFARYCTYRSHAAIGATLAAPISQFDLVITLVLALQFLGETLTPLRLAAIFLVFLGPIIAQYRPAKDVPDSPAAPTESHTPKFVPRLAEGYLFAALGALFLGSSPVLVKLGVDEAGASGSIVGALVSYIAATIVVGFLVVASGQLRQAFVIPREAVKWFNYAGFTVCCAHAFRYAALAIVPVTVAAPIMRLSHVFRIVFAWLINREHEVFTPWVMAGTFVSLIGAFLISLDTEAVIWALGLSDQAAALLRWHWPR